MQFSNEAFNDNSMMSFDNDLYGNFEDPVLMAPLEFPMDNKQPLPQVHKVLVKSTLKVPGHTIYIT